LLLLHSLRIVHMDIKPLNVMYSKSSLEWVFIDFGFSKTIKEEKGLKSLALFAGTLNYCSEEMQSRFSK
jgi:serine/threonine protein kinase